MKMAKHRRTHFYTDLATFAVQWNRGCCMVNPLPDNARQVWQLAGGRWQMVANRDTWTSFGAGDAVVCVSATDLGVDSTTFPFVLCG